MKKNKNTVGELIFGVHPIVELLKAKRRKIISIYTTKPQPKGWSLIEKLMPSYPVPIQYVEERDILTRMAETTDHQGVVAWVQPFAFQKKFFAPETSPFLLLLDGIQDPRNVGAILRSAYCLGVQGVILVKKGGAPLTATALKASAGLAEHLAIFVASSIQEAIMKTKAAGYNLYLATFGGKNACEVQFKMPLCLVIGSEGVGISPSILKEGIPVTLPQKTADISYNASVAASLLAFLIVQQNQNIIK
jgi:23S rRNA (guanosine2251-2'-O)-methyltransferase